MQAAGIGQGHRLLARALYNVLAGTLHVLPQGLHILAQSLPGLAQDVGTQALAAAGSFKGLPLVHVIGVALDGHQAGLRHFLSLLPAEVGDHGQAGVLVGVLPHGDANGEHGRVEVHLLEDGERQLVGAAVTVVKGDEHWLFRQGLSPVAKLHQLVHGDGGEAVFLQQLHLVLELAHPHGVLRDGGVVFLRHQVVVHENGDFHRFLQDTLIHSLHPVDSAALLRCRRLRRLGRRSPYTQEHRQQTGKQRSPTHFPLHDSPLPAPL